MNKRRILSIVLACAIIAGAVVGVPAAVRKVNGRNTQVVVVPVTELNYGGGFLATQEMEGYLTAGRTQSVYAGSTEVIKEVHVKEGQQVSKGDLLLNYDTTRTSINLELAKLNKEAVELEKDTAEKNLATLNKIRPVSDSDESGIGGDDALFPDDVIDDGETEEPEEENSEDETEKLKSEIETLKAQIKLLQEELDSTQSTDETKQAVKEQIREAFKEDDPDFYNAIEQAWNTDSEGKNNEEAHNFDKVVEVLTEKIKTMAARIAELENGQGSGGSEGESTDEGGEQTPEGGSGEGSQEGTEGSGTEATSSTAATAVIRPRASAMSYEADESGADTSDLDTGTSMPSIGSLITADETYTKEQLAEAKKEQQSILEDCALSLREANLGIRTAERALAKGEIRAEMDGVVRKVGDPKNPNMDGTPFLQVASEAGMSARGGIPELDLDSVNVGDPVMVTSWNTGMRYSGEITEISPYPDASGDFNMWGSSGSYYPFTAVLEETDEQIEEHEWVQITIGSAAADEELMGDDAIMAGEDPLAEDAGLGEGTGDEKLMLIRAFIREDADIPYVYKRGEDGLLEKQVVRLGKLSGDSYEIKSGVSTQDYLAFPYGKQVKEGAKTREGSMEDLEGM